VGFSAALRFPLRLFERVTSDFGQLLFGYTSLAVASTMVGSPALAVAVLELNVMVGMLCLKLQQVRHKGSI
jgi:hypothetical protein